MQEELIHLVWQNQLFNKTNLVTVSGQRLLILKQGLLNNDAGPDFNGAKTVMDQLEWIGDIEIHYNSSQWNTHKHDQDVAYNQVILHVVWEHDSDVYRNDGTQLPTLELKDRVQPAVLDQARFLVKNPNHVPCQMFLPRIDDIYISAAINRALVQRIEHKSDRVFKELQLTNGDWEEASFQLLADTMGSKVNGKALKELAQRLPINMLKKYAGNLFQIEALMFGISGLLHGEQQTDQYLIKLKQEFAFLAGKHGLTDSVMELSWWKFMRLRPSNFPTIRIGQLAQLVANSPNLFSLFVYYDSKQLKKKLKLVQSNYWQNHYTPGKPSKKPIPGLGQTTINNIILNVTVPLLVAYSRELNDLHYQEKAIDLMGTLPPEENRIIKMWNSLGITLGNAAESQGAIELFNVECSQKKCLSCIIGFQILKSV